MHFLLFAAAAAAVAEAVMSPPYSPFGYGDWTPPLCKIATRAISQARQEAAATSFCSSYLGIPRSTMISTVNQKTTTISTPAPSTATVAASPVTVTVPSSSTSTVSVTTTIKNPTSTFTSTVAQNEAVTLFTCVSPAAVATTPTATTTTTTGPVEKRQARPTVPMPGVLQTNSPGSALSSACRCLNIAPSTTTKLTTSTVVVTSTASASTTSVTTTPTVTINTLNTVTSYFTATTLDTIYETSTSTATVYARPTTAVQITVQGSGTDYDGRYLRTNATQGQSNSNILTEFIASNTLANYAPRELLFFIGQDDQSLTTQGNSGPDSRSRAYVGRYYNRNVQDVLNDANTQRVRVNFNYALTQADADNSNSVFVQCTMTTDAQSGACPVSCNVGMFDTTRPDGYGNHYNIRPWALWRGHQDTPPLALFGITPSS